MSLHLLQCDSVGCLAMRDVLRLAWGRDVGSASHSQVDDIEIIRLRREVQLPQPVGAGPIDGDLVEDQFQRDVETVRQFVASGELPSSSVAPVCIKPWRTSAIASMRPCWTEAVQHFDTRSSAGKDAKQTARNVAERLSVCMLLLLVAGCGQKENSTGHGSP